MPDQTSEAGAGETREAADGGGQRSLFGRLLDVFSSTADLPQAEPHPDAEPARAGEPGEGTAVSLLRGIQVDDVAIPRGDIVAVPVTISLADLVATFRDSGFSRLPVYEGTLDSPIGIIHLKDLALQQAFSDPKPKFDLRALVRPLLYAPPSMPAAVLLRKMQAGRTHMAVVIDEYGGVDGLVTIEDLIEEIVGRIDDEHDDQADALWVKDGPLSYVFQARAPLEDVEAELGLTLAAGDVREDVDTLGGLVSMLTGRVPAEGEVIPHDSGVTFEIVEADPRVVKRIRAILPHAPAP